MVARSDVTEDARRPVEASSREPDVLRIGREFGRLVAVEYPAPLVDVRVGREVTVPRGTGHARWLAGGTRLDPAGALPPSRKGRIDVLLEFDDEESGKPFVVVVEAKATDWDACRNDRIRVNVGRHMRQVWSYVEPLLRRVDEGELAWIQAALVYPRLPSPPVREQLEELAGANGITILWYDQLS